jgi:Flp pilus assembly pilin Flp
MGNLSAFIAVFLRNENGTTAVEYAVLLAAIAGPLALAAVILSNSLTVVLNDAADCVVVGCV